MFREPLLEHDRFSDLPSVYYCCYYYYYYYFYYYYYYYC